MFPGDLGVNQCLNSPLFREFRLTLVGRLHATLYTGLRPLHDDKLAFDSASVWRVIFVPSARLQVLSQ